ncbi:MAG: SIR2 family protein, partial [Planctomycetota bacterium]
RGPVEVAEAETEDEFAAPVRMVNRWLENVRQTMTRASWDVKNLYRTFEAAKSGDGAFPGGEELPILFEIAKRLHALLKQHEGLLHGLEDVKTEVFEAVEKDADRRHGVILLGARIDRASGAPVSDIPRFLEWAKKRDDDCVARGTDDGLFRSKSKESKERAKRLFTAKAAMADLLGKAKAELSFATLAKSLLIDEVPHALDLLEQGFARGEKTGRPAKKASHPITDALKQISTDTFDKHANLKRDLDGIVENPARYRALTPFRLKTVRRLFETAEAKALVPKVWEPFLRHSLEDWAEYEGANKTAPLDVERVFATPTSRFMLTTLLKLVEEPETLAGDAETFLAPPDREDFRSRRSIIADRFDPLAIASGGLGLERFLTTNYDFEIERYFQDRGYRHFDPHKALDRGTAADDPRLFRTNGFGGLMKDETFSAETATDLLAFAAGGVGPDASVFHLHGRATERDGIVATERDYMDLYLRGDDNREVVDDSILLAFAARPVLFLGFGMDEADILRPMRQFMSDQDRSVGYRATALLPADKSYRERAKVSSGLYMRYGAHTIFYGGGETLTNGADPQAIDWLHRIMALIKAIRQKAQAFLDEKTPDFESLAGKPLATLSWLSKEIGAVGADLERDKTLSEAPAIFRIVRFPEKGLEELQAKLGKELAEPILYERDDANFHRYE